MTSTHAPVGLPRHDGQESMLAAVCPVRPRMGCVANFTQEVMKGQLPLSVRRLSGQGIELCGRSEALVSSFNHHLSFLDHVHELNTS